MSQVLRPIINADHIVVTVKLDVEWAKVPVEQRAVILGGFEELAELTETTLKSLTTTTPKETTDAKH